MKMNLSRIRTILTFVIACFSGTVSATTYYAAPTGTTTASGTITDPLAFTTAIGKLNAGDILYVRGGTYSSGARITISRPGTSGNLIKILAYNGEQPVFDFSTEAYSSSNQGILLSGNYVQVKGFVVQGAGDNGMQVTGSNNVIEFCVFRWNCDSGLQMKTGSDNYILNCDSYENFDYKSTNSDGTPNYGGNADGFADKQYTNTGTNTYEGCRSWSNGDDGWDHYELISNTIYKNCWCYAMAPAQFDMTNHIRYNTDKAYIDGFTNHIITNYGNGNGFKLGGNYTAHNATLTNCISVGNPVKGFDQNNNNGTMTLYNCTSYKNKYNYGFSNSSYGTLVIRNCASLSSTSSNSLNCKTVTQDHNSWNTGFSCSATDFQSLDVTQMLLPRKSDGSLPDITLLHQVATSGMIDKGTTTGLPSYVTYSGNAPDLGAYEYSVSTGIAGILDDSGIIAYYSRESRNIVIKGDVSSVDVYNISGQLVYSKPVSSEDLSLDANGWNNGLYLLKIASQNGTVTVRKILIV
jgi:hypothetical protein